jgi:hypothetical protein
MLRQLSRACSRTNFNLNPSEAALQPSIDFEQDDVNLFENRKTARDMFYRNGRSIRDPLHSQYHVTLKHTLIAQIVKPGPVL